MRKKYLLFPGYVTSKTDGDAHYVSAGDLIKLYNVQAEDCEVYVFSRDANGFYKDLISLYPRDDGDYILPKTNT